MTGDTGPHPEAVARFAAVVRELAGAGALPPLAVAVSGGADSLALLWLAARAFPGKCTALSVNHGLRTEAASECEQVGRHAAELGVPHHVLTLDGLPPGPGLQARARAARYRAMGDWCAAHAIAFLLTAHHADDQAETLLLRLRRGSGLAGMAGIRRRSPRTDVTVLRPLLGWRRDDLRAMLPATWVVADDPSNRDGRHDRTHARALLAREPWLAPRRLAATAAHLADAEAALAWAAERASASRMRPTATGLLLDVEGLPFELRRRLLEQALAGLGRAVDGSAVARLARRLEAGGSGTLAGVRVLARADCWDVSPAPPRRESLT